MPLTVTGEGYRDFSEPRFFECETSSQVEQIRTPADKAHAIVAADDGTTDMEVWKFDLASAAAASATVKVPDNPAYAANGRWFKIPGFGGGGNTSSSAGSGSPEGVVTRSPGATYWDVTNQVFYVKDTGTGDTGWVALITL